MTNSIGDAVPVAVPPPRRYGWRRLLGFNLLSATVLAFSEDSRWLGAGLSDGSIRVWEIA